MKKSHLPFTRKQRFGLRKLSVGLASCFLGSVLLFGAVAQAETTDTAANPETSASAESHAEVTEADYEKLNTDANRLQNLLSSYNRDNYTPQSADRLEAALERLGQLASVQDNFDYQAYRSTLDEAFAAYEGLIAKETAQPQPETQPVQPETQPVQPETPSTSQPETQPTPEQMQALQQDMFAFYQTIENLVRDRYTTDSLAVFDQKLTALHEAIRKQSPVYSEVKQALEEAKAARQALQEKPVETPPTQPAQPTAEQMQALQQDMMAFYQAVENLARDRYTTDSLAEFDTKKAALEAAIQKRPPVYAEIRQALDQAKAAQQALKEKSVETPPAQPDTQPTEEQMRTLQQDMVAFFQALPNLVRDRYTTDSLTAFDQKLAALEAASKKQPPVYAELKQALEEAKTARQALQEKPVETPPVQPETPPTEAEVQQLQQEILKLFAQLEKVASTDYTPDSFQALRTALQELNAVLDQDVLSVSAVRAALDKTKKAYEKLVPKPADTTPPTSKPEVTDAKELVLHYRTPAATTYAGWERESLPIGNGDIGSKVFGLVGGEKIQFNEKTLWSGGPKEGTPYNGGNLDNKYTVLPEIRKALEEGNVAKAKQLAEANLIGPYNHQYGRYLAFGDVAVDFVNDSKNLADVTDYSRQLDIKTAIASTDYNYNNHRYHRESFVSYPDNVSVTHFTKTGTDKLNLDIALTPTMDLVASGFAKYDNAKSTFKESRVTYSAEGALLSGKVKDNDLKFASFLKVDTDGQVTFTDKKLQVVGATYATLYLSAETDFAQDPKNGYRDKEINVEAFVKETTKKASQKGYQRVKEAHIADYQSLFNRVKLSLTSEKSDKATDQLLREYTTENGQALEELFFQYGRYLMITSSRDGKNALPANLQGVWNAVDNPPWNSDYHLNVNLQMNYWPVYSSNIAETALPLINYIDDMRYYGRIAAAEYANIVSNEGEENGWLVHTQATPFGWTTPGWYYYWGWSPASNAWIMQNVYDYYRFTKDETFLREKIYPMLRETAKFWNSFLHYDKASDRYVSSPSYSPEHGTITIGNTYDQSLVWQLFHDFIEAATILNTDSDLVRDVTAKYEKLKPLHINSKGQIKEWYEEDSASFTGEKIEKGHRHVSHLVGLFPGTLFNKDNPKFLEAAKASLNDRGDGGTGWSKANKINLWARLLDGNRAHRLLAEQLRGSTLNNLWDTHTPFQIDGNFGATSGMTEMLLQSHSGYIAPLAALPDAWKTGEVSGLMARGNVEVAMKWANKNLTTLKLQAHKGGVIQIDYPNIETATLLVNGQAATFRIVQKDRIELTSQAGDVITFSNITERITDLTVTRQSANSALLRFTGIPGTQYYAIERTETTEAGAPVGKQVFKTTDTRFVDTTINNSNVYSYRVQPVTEEANLAFSDTARILPIHDTFDDRDGRIRYGSAFGDWPDNTLYGGTEKYADITTNRTTVSDDARTATIPFIGSGIEIYGLKSDKLGKADVLIDGQPVAGLDFYKADSAEKGVLIGRYDGLKEGSHTLTIRVSKEPTTRKNERNKVSLDYFKVLHSEAVNFEKLDDRDSRIVYGKGFKTYGDPALFKGTESYSDLDERNAPTPADATLSLTFEGTGIQIYGIKSSGLGKAKVKIDGQAVADLNFFKTGGAEKGTLVGEYTGLTNGRHTITIDVDPTPVTQGRRKVSLDYFIVLKETEQALQPAQAADARQGDASTTIQLPETEWTKIEVLLPNQTTPIVITKGENGLTATGATITHVAGQPSLTLALPATVETGLLKITTFRQAVSGPTMVALIKPKIQEEERSEVPNTAPIVEDKPIFKDAVPDTAPIMEDKPIFMDKVLDQTLYAEEAPVFDMAQLSFEKVPDSAPIAEDKPIFDLEQLKSESAKQPSDKQEKEQKPESKVLPSTGDTTSASLLAVGLLTGLAGLGFAKRKQED